MKVLILTSSLLALAASNIVSFYRPCDSVGKVVSLDVTPCDSNPCQFPRGRNVTLRVTFTSDRDIVAAKPAVFAHLGFINVPEPFPMEQDSCQHFDSPCPLAANAQHVYTSHVYIQPVYPKIRVVAEWQIRDQDDRPIVCFAVPAEVID